MSEWRPISSAPRGISVLLACAGTHVPIYCGRQRYGALGEPQQGAFAWRCDSSGTFANPTHWMPLPAPPGTADQPSAIHERCAAECWLVKSARIVEENGKLLEEAIRTTDPTGDAP